MTAQPNSSQIRVVRGLILGITVSCSVFAVSGVVAQTSSTTPASTQFDGSEHPEMFQHRIAFEILLHLLEIDPNDAPHRQQVARSIELNDMSLTDNDAAALEQVVEKYRVNKNYIEQQVGATRSLPGEHHDDLVALHLSREKLLNNTAAELTRNLSHEGRVAIKQYLERIISRSQLTVPTNSTGNY